MHLTARNVLISAFALALAAVGSTEAVTNSLDSGIAAPVAAQRRASQQQTAKIITVMDLQPGMTLADVGAGRGEWAVALAQHVGPTGQVYATDIDSDRLDDMRRRIDRADVANVTPTLGTPTETGLPDDCCDAILIRAAYHEFTDPEPMLASLLRALRPGGTLAVIDFPGNGSHEIESARVVEEFTAAGFDLLRNVDDWDVRDQYCLLFTR